MEDKLLPHCGKRGICIQAGGAVGAWPITYAKYFQEVYSFEPNPALWECYTKNLEEAEHDVSNIQRFHMGLSDEEGFCDMVDVQSNNMGAWHIKPAETGTPMTQIDTLNIPGCDLLQLDVEGGEVAALRGASQTIKKYRPIICVESKGATLRAFGLTVDDLRGTIARFGYKMIDRFSRDEVWVPRD